MHERITQLQDTVRNALREADDLWIRSPRGSIEAFALSDVGIGLERAAIAMAQITSPSESAFMTAAEHEASITKTMQALIEGPPKQEP